MLNIKNLIIISIIFVLALPIANASIDIMKEAPTQVTLGDEVTIDIYLRNDGTETEEVYVIEMNSFFSNDTNGKIPTYDVPDNVFALPPNTIEWNFNLEPKASKHLYYNFYAVQTGEFMIPQTEVYYGDEELKSDIIEFVVFCNNNGECEENLYETSSNCPDCGGEDPMTSISTTLKAATTTISTPTTTLPAKSNLIDKIGEEKEDSNNTILYVILAILGVAVIALVILKGFKKKGPKEDYSDIMQRLQK